MITHPDLFTQDEPQADDVPATDPIAPSMLGNLAPIMHPDSLRRIEAAYQRWLAGRRAREQERVWRRGSDD